MSDPDPARTDRPGGPAGFDAALRGYDRRQVDARVAALTERLAAVEANHRAALETMRAAQERADTLQHELRVAANRVGREPGDRARGFGYHAERILRMAETEAHDVRAAAGREAAELLERVRAEAEAHRHAIEQEAIARQADTDRQASETAAQLRERERRAADELAAAREEAEAVRAAARRDAERIHSDVEAVARDVRTQAERWAEQQQAAAAREVERLTELRSTVHRDLARLAEVLAAGRADAPAGTPEQAGRPDHDAAGHLDAEPADAPVTVAR